MGIPQIKSGEGKNRRTDFGQICKRQNWRRARSKQEECRPGKGGATNGQKLKVISGTRVSRGISGIRGREIEESEKRNNQRNMSNHQPALRTVRWTGIVGIKCLACIRCYARVRWDVSIGCNVNDLNSGVQKRVSNKEKGCANHPRSILGARRAHHK